MRATRWWWWPPLCVSAHVLFWGAWMALCAWRYGGDGPVAAQGELGWALLCLLVGAACGIGAGAATLYRAALEVPWWGVVPCALCGLASIWLGGFYGWVALIFLGA
jgi:hypothetical protein